MNRPDLALKVFHQVATLDAHAKKEAVRKLRVGFGEHKFEKMKKVQVVSKPVVIICCKFIGGIGLFKKHLVPQFKNEVWTKTRFEG